LKTVPAAPARLHLDRAAVLLDDGVAGRETEPRRSLGRVERLEDLDRVVTPDPRAPVGDLDLSTADPAARPLTTTSPPFGCASQALSTRLRKTCPRSACRPATRGSPSGQIELEAHGRELRPRPHELGRLARRGAEIDRRQGARAGSECASTCPTTALTRCSPSCTPSRRRRAPATSPRSSSDFASAR
jgi:hypothetical protein